MAPDVWSIAVALLAAAALATPLRSPRRPDRTPTMEADLSSLLSRLKLTHYSKMLEEEVRERAGRTRLLTPRSRAVVLRRACA